MVIRWLVIVLLLIWSDAPAEQSPGSRMFDRLRSLAGQWEGTFEWSGARSGRGLLTASYEVTGNGSAVIESLTSRGAQMTSVYHLDGIDLRVTHFCAARNQPRLKADLIDEELGTIRFAFVDVTNAGASNPGYVERLELVLSERDRVGLEFTFQGGDARATERIELRRLAPPVRPWE